MQASVGALIFAHDNTRFRFLEEQSRVPRRADGRATDCQIRCTMRTGSGLDG